MQFYFGDHIKTFTHLLQVIANDFTMIIIQTDREINHYRSLLC